MKPVLMIHEVTAKLFDRNLEEYTLTFDDGLYSQYYHYDKFKNINTDKIFFISSNILCDTTQSTEFPVCEIAHEKAFNGNTEDYMTLAQVKELMQDPQVTIGGHSHYHKKLTSIPKIILTLEHMIDDTQLMLQWFNDNLGIKPTKFCFPYNDDRAGLYTGILRNFGFTEFYGKERIIA